MLHLTLTLVRSERTVFGFILNLLLRGIFLGVKPFNHVLPLLLSRKNDISAVVVLRFHHLGRLLHAGFYSVTEYFKHLKNNYKIPAKF